MMTCERGCYVVQNNNNTMNWRYRNKENTENGKTA